MRYLFIVLAAILCVCVFAACNHQPAIDRVPTPDNSDVYPTRAEDYHATPVPTVMDGQIDDTDPVQKTTDTADMSDDELIDYLLSEVMEAYEMVEEYGMFALVTGETTELEGICRDVWLGTNDDGKFTREILYTISPGGEIYEYNPLEDRWEIRNGDSLTILAYVKLNEVLEDGLVQILVDEVMWVDDSSQPNGYAIDNEMEDWIPYTATLWTEYYVWVDVQDAGMEYFQINLDNFIDEMQERPGGILADVGISEEGIWLISERYTP